MRRLLLTSKLLLSLSVGVCSGGQLTKTYPDSPVTTLRLEAFQAVINDLAKSTYTHSYSTQPWDNTTNYLINEILDKEVEQYMVFPTTGPCPVGWQGWKFGFLNGKPIYVSCP